MSSNHLNNMFLGWCALIHLAWFCPTATAGLDGHCPPLGPVLPAPKAPSSHAAVQSAVESLTGAITREIASSLNHTALSISVASIHESTPLLDLHATPPGHDGAAVSAGTVYRIASVSKLFTVYALLRLPGVSLHDPVTRYLPELRGLRPGDGDDDDEEWPIDAVSTPDWDEITLQSLASHMSGIGADFFIDVATFGNGTTPPGFPELDESDKPGCSGLLGTKPCSRADFFDKFGRHPPNYAPFTSPVYSNIAFTLLAFVIEDVSGQSFEEYVQNMILDPLGMTNTTVGEPPKNESWGFVPENDPWWAADLGIENAAGGIYSNTADMLTFGASILQHKLLSPSATRRWMKPLTATSSAGVDIGAPWEIFRSANATADGRLVEYYAKGGDVGTYHSVLCLVPDYGLVVSILAGGAEASYGVVALLLTRVVAALVPAVETAGRAEARAAYAGTYANARTNSSLVLAVDDDAAPGLRVDGWVARGVDVPAGFMGLLAHLTGGAGGAGGGDDDDDDDDVLVPVPVPVRVRLYPTNLRTGRRVAWRASFDTSTAEDVAAADAQLFYPQGTCLAWGSIDRVTYGQKAVDELVFEMERDGDGREVACAVYMTGLRLELQKET